MKTTVNSILVLSLVSAIDSLTRKVLSQNVQKNLFKEGIKWGDGGTEPDCLAGPYLVVENGELFQSNPAEMLLHLLTSNEVPQRFDVNTDYQAFIEAVKQQKINDEAVIDGVKVKITKDSVELDPTDLLASVANKAKEAQSAEFGR